MHVHLPKPLHGWREFTGEVGIIVLGVLIALAAEQVVETIHSRYQVGETRKSLDSELSRDLAAYQWRFSERPCAQARVKELDRWAKAMAEGRALKLKKEITQPIFFSINTSVWQATNGDAAARMPLAPKLDYASLYDVLRTYDEISRDEAEAWTTISAFQENTDLTRAELHQVRQALLDLQADDDILDVFGSRFGTFAAKLNIRPKQHIEQGIGAQVLPARRQLCEPLL
jgi:hypothetical protein